MRNKYKGPCYKCGQVVEVGKGHFERHRGGWRTIHVNCVFTQRDDKAIMKEDIKMRTLECSTKSDTELGRSLSAFNAHVYVFDKADTIENHYQLSKILKGGVRPKDWRQGKGSHPIALMIGDHEYDVMYKKQWYFSLWFKFLEIHPEIVQAASQYEMFSDMFGGKDLENRICQADAIHMYIKLGREAMQKFVAPLMQEIKSNNSRS
jgi:hypothetical protein